MPNGVDKLNRAQDSLEYLELKEANISLRVLLKQRNDDQLAFEQKIVSNVTELVLPYILKLQETQLDPKQRSYLCIVETNLEDIVSPFVQKLQTKFLRLTPMEVQVANLVKHGQTTKEMSTVLNLSVKTIETHRRNIRKKLGINNKKANLRSFLLNT
jgi:DNA-binding CsgD family transcriptional regulator